ncbi:hypothetical protein PHYC_01850 [Phycisphaerales bacterium]|nr:hypothetical protein PHYC_01850 [Phycisphaerales bacterium]
MKMLVLSAWIFACPSFAQDQPPAGEGVLRGPTVPEQVARTLVRRDARGNFQRLDGRPEDAAVALLELEPAAREQAKSVGGDRAVSVGILLIDHIDQVKVIAEANEKGERDRAAELLRDLRKEFEPEPSRNPLLPKLAEVLTNAQEAELMRLVDDYWNAWIDWELRNSKDKSEKARERVAERLSFSLFQQEVRQAYERVIKPYRDKIEGLYLALDPTDEQREAIREIVIGYIREARTRPTSEQRRAVLGKIYRALDEERKARFFDIVAKEISAG